MPIKIPLQKRSSWLKAPCSQTRSIPRLVLVLVLVVLVLPATLLSPTPGASAHAAKTPKACSWCCAAATTWSGSASCCITNAPLSPTPISASRTVWLSRTHAVARARTMVMRPGVTTAKRRRAKRSVVNASLRPPHHHLLLSLLLLLLLLLHRLLLLMFGCRGCWKARNESSLSPIPWWKSWGRGFSRSFRAGGGKAGNESINQWINESMNQWINQWERRRKKLARKCVFVLFFCGKKGRIIVRVRKYIPPPLPPFPPFACYCITKGAKIALDEERKVEVERGGACDGFAKHRKIMRWKKKAPLFFSIFFLFNLHLNYLA